MFSFERRWVGVVLASFAPAEGPGLAPRPHEAVDYFAAFETLRTRSTRIAGLGLRAALWLVVLSPWWLGRSLSVLTGLPQAARLTLLAELLEHRVFAVREAVFLLKLTACLALLGHADVRARSGYDGRSPRALPLLGKP